jgi:hypothetical protein
MDTTTLVIVGVAAYFLFFSQPKTIVVPPYQPQPQARVVVPGVGSVNLSPLLSSLLPRGGVVASMTPLLTPPAQAVADVTSGAYAGALDGANMTLAGQNSLTVEGLPQSPTDAIPTLPPLASSLDLAGFDPSAGGDTLGLV